MKRPGGGSDANPPRRLEAEPVAGLAHRALAWLVILALVSGCDNVEWGGASIALRPPPPAVVGTDTAVAVDDSAQASEVPPPPLPDGPVLFAGTRTGETLRLVPLFEFRGDSIIELTREDDAPGYIEHFNRTLLSPGAEFTVFADGVRVGTMVAESSGVTEDWCAPRPVVTGTPELVPSASGATRFLALSRGDAPAGPHATGAFPAVETEHRQASLRLAQTAIMRESALWPDDLAQARADLAVTRLAPDADPTVVATFMFRDRLAVEDPGTPVAYGLLVVGSQTEDRYLLDHTWYRRIGDDGKAAPRFVQQFDWDADGHPEVLLEVMGTEARWPAVLEWVDGEWSVAYEAGCS